MNKDIFCKGYTWGFFSKRGDFQTEAAEKSMERLASNGLNWMCIPVNALQESFASTEFSVIMREHNLTKTLPSL